MKNKIIRCGWVTEDEVYQKYHDDEWGRPVYDDRTLFEFLILEGAQAGLSWLTVLKRRQAYQEAFFNFDVDRVARMTESDVDRLMIESGIIKHRLKIESVITNARAYQRVQKEFGSFSKYCWSFVNHEPIVNRPQSLSEILPKSNVSDAMSKDMKKRGFKFVGSTILYAFLQANGLVNDHTADCFLYPKD